METRDKVRILLLNPMGEVLLMLLDDPTATDPNDPRDISSRWITIGGGIEPGETIAEAARREAHEETGLSDIQIGPQLDYREVVFHIHGQPVLFRETYVAATTRSWDYDHRGWTEEERAMIRDMRWWSLEKVAATGEVLFPHDLVEMMKRALAGTEGPVD